MKLAVVAGALVLYSVVWLWFRITNRGKRTFFFDPMDCFNDHSADRVLPAAAKTTTFEPMLKHYLTTTQLLVTVGAASIAFGVNPHDHPIGVSKLVLACSVFFGVVFCGLLLWRYDEYTQDVKSYTLSWYSTIFAFGISSLICFMGGYAFWGFEL
jgi:heme A synthase